MEQPTDYKLLRQQYLAEEARLQVEAAKLRLQQRKCDLTYSQNAIRPSMQIPIQIRRDGTRWLCIFETDDEEFLNNVMAYGDSPAQAMLNFDHVWLGTGKVLPSYDAYVGEDDEDDEDYEEQF